MRNEPVESGHGGSSGDDTHDSSGGVQSLEEVRRLESGVAPLEFMLTDRESAYRFITQTPVRFDYGNCKKGDKGMIKAYMGKLSGLSRFQLTRLIRQHQQTGKLVDYRGRGPARPPVRRYTGDEIRLLAETMRHRPRIIAPS